MSFSTALCVGSDEERHQVLGLSLETVSLMMSKAVSGTALS